MVSGRLLDYIGQDDIASRPVAPDIAANAIAFFWATDELKLYIYEGDIPAWRALPIRFIDLLDVPNDLTGLANEFVTVKADETGLETTAVVIPTQEQVEDWVGALIAGTSGITATYNDLGGVESLTLDVEYVQDMIATFLGTPGTGIVVTYNDAGNLLAIAVDFSMVMNNQIGTTYTPVLADANRKYIRLDNASPIDLTIPADGTVAYPIGTQLTFEQTGAGLVSILAAGGVTLNYLATLTLDFAGQFAVVQAVKTDTDEWTVFGALEPL